MTRLQNAQRSEGSESSAKCRPADLKQLRQIALRGETLAGFQFPLLNQFAKVIQNLFGRTPIS